LFFHGLKVQIRIIMFMLYREVKVRFGRNGIGLATEVLNILVLIALFVGLRVLAGAGSHRGMQVGPFVAIGMVSVVLFRTIFNTTLSSNRSYRSWSLYPQITFLDIAIVRWIYTTILYCLVAYAIFNLMLIYGFSDPIENEMGVFSVFIMISVFGFFLGLCARGLLPDTPLIRVGLTMFNRVIFWTSGTFFVVPELPYAVREYLLYNPLLHMTEMARSEYFYVYKSDYASDQYVELWFAVLVFAGLVIERATRYRWAVR